MRTNRPDEWEDEDDLLAPEELASARPAHRRRRHPLKTVAVILAVLLTLSAIGGVGGGFYLWGMFGRMDHDDRTLSPLRDEEVSTAYDPSAYAADRVADLPLMGDTDEVTNILLVGVDGDTFEGRADTNLLLSINEQKKTIKLISLMRDTWVTLPDVDEDGDGWDDDDRLNAAYSLGGITLHAQMIAQNFRIHIDKYVAVNFAAFPAVIDAMGGVDVDCRGEEAERVPAAGTTVTYGGAGYIPMGTTDGVYHMDGYQALQYARIRYLDADGDFSRTSRQRKLLSLMIGQTKDMSLFQLHDAVYDAAPAVRTNMSRATCMGLALDGLGYLSYDVDTSYRIPPDGGWEDANLYGMAVLRLTDPVAAVTDLHRYIYG